MRIVSSDVATTGEAEFAKTYLAAERLERWGTVTTLLREKGPTGNGEKITFTAKVTPTMVRGERATCRHRAILSSRQENRRRIEAAEIRGDNSADPDRRR